MVKFTVETNEIEDNKEATLNDGENEIDFSRRATYSTKNGSMFTNEEDAPKISDQKRREMIMGKPMINTSNLKNRKFAYDKSQNDKADQEVD